MGGAVVVSSSPSAPSGVGSTLWFESARIWNRKDRKGR